MRRADSHVLEDQSLVRFRLLLEPWIVDKPEHDYGVDLEVKLVDEKGDVTNQVFWVQMKASAQAKRDQAGEVLFSAETKHLAFWETCRFPVALVYWIQEDDAFYWSFIQEHIWETLDQDDPTWREKTRKTIAFPESAQLTERDQLVRLATDGFYYVFQRQAKSGPGGALFWVGGIPAASQEEVRRRTQAALTLHEQGRYADAAREFEALLVECTLSPTERMSTYLSLGNVYFTQPGYAAAERCFSNTLTIARRGDATPVEMLMAGAAALGNLGLVFLYQGKLDDALAHAQTALQAYRTIHDREGEAIQLGNIGLTYADRGDLDDALSSHQAALGIYRELGMRSGEADQLGNIGNILSRQGQLDEAQASYEAALAIDRAIGYRQGEGINLCNLGNVYYSRGKYPKALAQYKAAHKIDRAIGNRQGEAITLGNIGSVHYAAGWVIQARDEFQAALDIDRAIGYRLGEAEQLANLGMVFAGASMLPEAEVQYKAALELNRAIGNRPGEADALGSLGIVYAWANHPAAAEKHLVEALQILDECGLEARRDTFQTALENLRAGRGTLNT